VEQGRHTEVHGSTVDGSPAYEKGLDRKKLPTGFHELDELLGGGWPLGTLTDRQRQILLGASIMGVHGELQKQDGVVHVIARGLEDMSALLQELQASSRDFH
jgi:hypothetical protein